MHANYVEAILDSRLFPGWSPLALHLVEGAGAALVVLIFVLEAGAISKALAVAAVVLILVALSAFSLLVFGLVLDFLSRQWARLVTACSNKFWNGGIRPVRMTPRNHLPEVDNDVVDSNSATLIIS